MEFVIKAVSPQQDSDLFKGELAVPVTFDICYMQHPNLVPGIPDWRPGRML